MNFGFELVREFPTISEIALNILLPFCATHLCKVTFSALTIIESKYHSNSKHVEDALSMSHTLSNIQPRFAYFSKKKQEYIFH